MGKAFFKKKHLPVLWSPEDLGLKSKGPCSMVSRCGISLDKYGYLPCSSAIMIARVFKLTHLYKRELPGKAWGMEELCRHCVFGLPDDWCRENVKPLSECKGEFVEPTKSWRKALSEFDPQEFYRTMKEY